MIRFFHIHVYGLSWRTDVFVIDARGETRCGTMGAILATRMDVRGVAGLVTDGVSRVRHQSLLQSSTSIHASGKHCVRQVVTGTRLKSPSLASLAMVLHLTPTPGIWRCAKNR